MHKIKYLFFLACFVSAQRNVCGQKSNPVIIKRCPVKVLGIEQGLLHVTTNSIVTDSLGYTWVSTRLGLQRYNGYRLENINPVVDKDTILINTPVYLFGLKNGGLWICYNKGILEYSPFTNSFKKIGSFSDTSSSFFSTVPLAQTQEGIWCMLENKGIVIYRDGSFNPIGNDITDIQMFNTLIGSQDIMTRKIIAENGNYIFIRLNARQLFQFNTKSRQTAILNVFEGTIIGLGCNPDKLFVTTTNNLYSYSIPNHKLLKAVPTKSIYNDNLIFSSVQPSGVNQVLISTNGRLFEFDTALESHREITTLSRDPVGHGSFEHQIYIDKMKRVWVLTNNDIEIVRNTEIPFEHFIYPAAKSNSVRTMYYDRDKGLLLAGCISIDTGYNGGIRLFDTLSNPLWEKPLISAQVSGINAIEKLDTDHYLIITFDGHGWYMLNLKEKKLSPFVLQIEEKTKSELYSNQWINNLQRIDDTTIYIASPVNIYKCIFKTNKLISARPLLPFNSNSTNFVTSFLYAADQTLWVGTNAGLVYRVRKNKEMKNAQTNGNYIIRCFAQDSMKHIWIGTDKGICIYTENGMFIRRIDLESGLLNDYIYAILPVGKTASVFASNNMGLSFISFDGIIKNYTKELGLQSNEFNTESALKTETGKLYFGGVNGINSFYPSELTEIKDTPILNITRLAINDSLFNALSGSWTGDSLLLPYWQNHIQLDFAALGLLNTDEYTYTYRLKDFEDSWQTTHQPTGIKYTLSPGKYILEMNCSPIHSPENIFKKRIYIEIDPPWWQSWWFRIITMLFIIGLITLIIWQYNRKKFAQKIKQLQVQQEIQQERERISRDLHDNLGAYAAAIAANVSKAKETSDDSGILEELQNNSQAIINQLNDTIWALNREAISLTAISDRFKIFLQKIQPSYPHIMMAVKEYILTDTKLSPAHALHLFRIMQEAVNNAARHSNCKQITISINSNSICLVSITDDGKGIKMDAEKTPGNGLKNMKERASEAGWEIKWENQKPQGTQVMIVLSSGEEAG
jgi:signal transduction histidine kinase